MQKSYLSGHEITCDVESDNWGDWKYVDSNEAVTSNIRTCVRCNRLPTWDGHDFCVRNLGKVANACCGHGVEVGYIQFEDGTIITGYFEVNRKPVYGELIEDVFGEKKEMV